MKYEAVGNWIIAHALVIRNKSPIVLVNPAHGITRHYWIEVASEGAVKEGYKPGDMVVATGVYDMYLYRGDHRVVLTTDMIFSKVHEFSLEDFDTVKDNKPFVPPPIANGSAQASA
jgi:hypothetical protein